MNPHRGISIRLAAAATCTALVACATPSSAGDKLPQTDAATAAAIDRALAGSHRSAANKARDVYRHPKETLTFFGLRQDMTVVELWPGSGGWYTEVLAPVLKDKGKLYAAHVDPVDAPPGGRDGLKSYKDKLAANPELYGKVDVTVLWNKGADIAPPGSADMVVTFRNIHNWMGRDWAPQAFAAAYQALKPGGVFGVEEHRGNPAVPQDPKAASGYVNEDYAIRMIEAAGFKLVDRSEINANPKDTKDYEKGVWTLPPNYRMGDVDRAKYAAIGESDRFTLKFVKPAS
jgi:predicted methyltransferase